MVPLLGTPLSGLTRIWSVWNARLSSDRFMVSNRLHRGLRTSILLRFVSVEAKLPCCICWQHCSAVTLRRKKMSKIMTYDRNIWGMLPSSLATASRNSIMVSVATNESIRA